MGNERSFREGLQFSNYEYTTASPRVTINGITGKTLEKKSDFADIEAQFLDAGNEALLGEVGVSHNEITDGQQLFVYTAQHP